MIAATVTCSLGCVLLVLAEWRGHRGVRIVAKLVASASFVIVGAQAVPGALPTTGFGGFVLAGLVLGAIGDVALLGRSKPRFLAGLAAFLLGHLAYVAGISLITPASRWLVEAGLYAALPVVAGAVAIAVLWPRLGAMRAAVVGYVLAIVVLVIAAIAAARSSALPDANRTRLVVGAAVFFVSDLAVARDRFVARAFNNKLWGLPANYAGQLLIAWSLVER